MDADATEARGSTGPNPEDGRAKRAKNEREPHAPPPPGAPVADHFIHLNRRLDRLFESDLSRAAHFERLLDSVERLVDGLSEAPKLNHLLGAQEGAQRALDRIEHLLSGSAIPVPAGALAQEREADGEPELAEEPGEVMIARPNIPKYGREEPSDDPIPPPSQEQAVAILRTEQLPGLAAAASHYVRGRGGIAPVIRWSYAMEPGKQPVKPGVAGEPAVYRTVDLAAFVAGVGPLGYLWTLLAGLGEAPRVRYRNVHYHARVGSVWLRYGCVLLPVNLWSGVGVEAISDDHAPERLRERHAAFLRRLVDLGQSYQREARGDDR